MLGLIDNLIGISNAGYQAKLMNIHINTKTAEKRLQFGVSKCKSIIIEKLKNTDGTTQLIVDGWNPKHMKIMNNRET